MTSETKISFTDLIAEKGNKSMMYKLRQNFVEIEEAIRAGISYQDIIKKLEEDGLGIISLPTFKKALYRIRQQKKKHAIPPKNNRGLAVSTPRTSLTSSALTKQSNPNENCAPFTSIGSANGKKMSIQELLQSTDPDTLF